MYGIHKKEEFDDKILFNQSRMYNVTWAFQGTFHDLVHDVMGYPSIVEDLHTVQGRVAGLHSLSIPNFDSHC